MLSSHPNRGLTLIELMVAIAILAILLGFAIPSMTRFAANWRLTNAINAFQGSVKVARTEAITRSKVVRLCRTTDASPETCAANAESTAGSANTFATGWMVYVDYDNDSTYDPATTKDGSSILLKQASVGGLSQIRPSANTANLGFLPNGLIQTGGNTTINFEASQYVSGDSNTNWAKKTLCITATGKAVAGACP